MLRNISGTIYEANKAVFKLLCDGFILNLSLIHIQMCIRDSSQNGVAGFLLANGALSDDGTELTIRQQLIENHLVEAIMILPRNLFYTTDISVTLWVLNKNKKARVVEQNGCLLYTSRCV